MVKMIVVLLLATVFFIPDDKYSENIPEVIIDLENITNAVFLNDIDKAGIDAPVHFEVKVTEKNMRDIDARVAWINECLNHDNYRDYYEGDVLVYKRFHYEFESEWAADDSFASYRLYYDKHGNLIYADIAHYRSTMYFMYFQNDELLHVETGSINGNLAHVEAVIKEDVRYAFILEDLARCLEHAYK